MTTMKTAAQARRDRGREEMRAQILDAALRIVTDDGVAALSMRGVARAIGYSPASLYEYFASKEELCKGLFFEGTSGLSRRMEEAMTSLPPDAPIVDRLGLLGSAYRQHALSHPDIYLLAFSSVSSGYTPSRQDVESGMSAFGFLIDAMRAGVDQGELMAADPGSLAIAAWSSVHGFVMLELNHMISPSEEECSNGLTPQDVVDRLFDDNMRILAMGMLRRSD